MPKNVASRVKLPTQKRRKRETLSAENIGAFFSAASENRFGALYVLAVTSGLRPGELLALKWEDVDLEAGALSVRRSVSEDEDRPIIREETKTSAGRRLEPCRTEWIVFSANDEFSPAAYADLLEDGLEVIPHSVGRDVQLLGDFDCGHLAQNERLVISPSRFVRS